MQCSTMWPLVIGISSAISQTKSTQSSGPGAEDCVLFVCDMADEMPITSGHIVEHCIYCQRSRRVFPLNLTFGLALEPSSSEPSANLTFQGDAVECPVFGYRPVNRPHSDKLHRSVCASPHFDFDHRQLITVAALYTYSACDTQITKLKIGWAVSKGYVSV